MEGPLVAWELSRDLQQLSAADAVGPERTGDGWMRRWRAKDVVWTVGGASIAGEGLRYEKASFSSNPSATNPIHLL